MRISIPFSYSVKAVEFKHKLPSNLTMVEKAWVEVPDVDASELDLALVVRSSAGLDIERVYAFAGQFWVKDNREAADLPFVAQHLSAAGRPIPSSSGSGHHEREREKSELEEVTKLLGKVGILRTRTAGIGRWEAKQWLYNTPDGFDFLEKTVESERARAVTGSDREERLRRAQRIALEQTICVDGQLFHRVAEPVIASGHYGLKMQWTFGCPDFLSEAGISKNGGYPVSAKDFNRIHEWFDTDNRAVDVDFSFDVVDDRNFKIRADRIALLSGLQRAIKDGLSNTNSTPYIAKWCQLRDWVSDLWQGPDGKLSSKEVLEKDDREFDALAGVFEELMEFGESPRYGSLSVQGLKMWDSRAVSLAVKQRNMQP
ncbi:hypothetical protein [Rhizobium sp. BK176]|uniref:hypothetical protein n=1 Tax=Rhizobium sp. BK176 TaxID=2587071 RepID=UPI002167CC2F|nr:hypothetical protein [Rhizobium sp. BK176]MCS4088889.1 hypothetical protein [Rhizobium sp. BK176]